MHEINKFFEERGNLLGLGMGADDKKDDDAMNEVNEKIKELQKDLGK
jgi:hypothetical protein